MFLRMFLSVAPGSVVLYKSTYQFLWDSFTDLLWYNLQWLYQVNCTISQAVWYSSASAHG